MTEKARFNSKLRMPTLEWVAWRSKLHVMHSSRKNVAKQIAFGGGWTSTGNHKLKCQQGASEVINMNY